MSFLNNIVSTLAAPVNATVGAAIGVDVLPVVKEDEALVYRTCVGGANISADHVALTVGEYSSEKLEQLGLKDRIVGIRPGKNVQVTVFNDPAIPYVIGHNLGEQCLPQIWQNQVKALKIELVSQVSRVSVEGFATNTLYSLLNILLVLLVLFIIYKLVA